MKSNTSAPAGIQHKANKLLSPEAYTVRMTYDYAQFKSIIGNRPKNDIHIRRLVKSMQLNYLFSPIMVNERMEIIDGQHRFDAIKENGLPVYFIIVPGYGLNEVKILNTNTSNWNKMDYLFAYCEEGVLPYLQMKEFMEKYRCFGVASSEAILTDNTGGTNNKGSVANGKGRLKNFEEGRLLIPDLQKAYDNAERIMVLQQYYDGFNRGVFVRTLIALFKNPQFSFTEFLSKLKLVPGQMVHCSTIEQYKLLIEEIYNWKRREKVNLRY